MAAVTEEIRVLMVEDDKYEVDRYRLLTENRQEISIVYDTGSETDALRYLSNNKIDVMIMNPELAEGDGVSLMAEIEEQHLEKPFTVVITNLSSNVTLSYFRANGADCVYQKMNALYSPVRVLSVIQKIYPFMKYDKPCREPIFVMKFNEQKEETVMRENLMYELQQMVIKRSLVGFRFLVEAVMLYMKCPEEHVHITNDIYPEIARRMQVTTMAVERSIRSAIESAFTRANITRLQRYYPFPYDDEHGRPTNTQFISNMARRIRIRN